MKIFIVDKNIAGYSSINKGFQNPSELEVKHCVGLDHANAVGDFLCVYPNNILNNR